MSRLETERWTGFAGAVLFVASVGIVLREPALLVAGAIGIGYLAEILLDERFHIGDAVFEVFAASHLVLSHGRGFARGCLTLCVHHLRGRRRRPRKS